MGPGAPAEMSGPCSPLRGIIARGYRYIIKAAGAAGPGLTAALLYPILMRC